MAFMTLCFVIIHWLLFFGLGLGAGGGVGFIWAWAIGDGDVLKLGSGLGVGGGGSSQEGGASADNRPHPKGGAPFWSEKKCGHTRWWCWEEVVPTWWWLGEIVGWLSTPNVGLCSARSSCVRACVCV